MSENISVSCACKSVTVEVIGGAPSVFSAICHCINCREITGAPAFWANAWPTDQIKVTGETISYKHEVNVRYSCTTCGSFTHESVPAMGLFMLPAARLENPAPPMMHVFVKSKVYPLPEDGLPRFEELPPM